jgi:hypothetical protein
MTTATTATAGKVVSSLVKEYSTLVHSTDEGIRNWWRSAAKVSSVRDLAATIKKAQEFGEVRGIKPAYANNARLAVKAFDIKGADKVAVTDLMKVVEVAQRALKVEGALVLAGKVADFAEFEAKAKEAEGLRKAGKTPRAKAEKVTTRGATMDAIIEKALADMGELEDVTIGDFDKAEYLIGALKSALASSKAVAVKHPTRKAVNA